MIVLILAVTGFALALFPAILFVCNLRLYRPLPFADGSNTRQISLLIPARNEALSIRSALDAALASEGVELEVIVLDDDSNDATATIVAEVARRDARVRLATAPPLPTEWCGKQHACHVLSALAQHEILVWVDADVTLKPDALCRMADRMRRGDVGLLSGFPRQRTETLLERLLIPFIHFILLGYLPIGMMRRSNQPALGAGCGQLFMARRADYLRAGGHAAIRSSLHDGIQLPRAFRRADVMTDLFDATDIADCRMYRSASEVWNGLLKNAAEGMAAPGAIVPWTILLAGGQILPAAITLGLLAHRALHPADANSHYLGLALLLSASAWALSTMVRAISAICFRQSWIGAIAHPFAVALLLVNQMQALYRAMVGTPPTWRGRDYPAKGSVGGGAPEKHLTVQE